MIRHRDAEKQQRQNLKHRARNRNAKDALKGSLKSGRAAAASKDPKGVAATVKLIGKTASAGIIHKRKASRLISRLAKAANRAKAAK
jgi:small subunit ribosomal protein S20